MSKPNSGHFKGTTGEKIASYKYSLSQNHAIINESKDDLREHPCKYKQPVTPYEHLYGYHGGNYKNSLPGKPINDIKQF